MKKSSRSFRIIAVIILSLSCAMVIIPFYLLVLASFSEESYVALKGYSLLPRREMLSLEAYSYLLKKASFFGRGYLITSVVTLLGTVFSVIISMMFSYMLSKQGLPFRGVLTFLVVFTMLFNGGQVATYINYATVIHVKNTLFGYLLPGLLMNAFNIFLFRNYFTTSIPQELYEAAEIDGSSEFNKFFKIVIPLSKPIIATIGLMSAVSYWNDWQNGIYYIDNTKLYGIQNILNSINSNAKYLAQQGLAGASIPTEGVRMAAAVLGILPILILYPFFQQYFVKGITAGALKG